MIFFAGVGYCNYAYRRTRNFPGEYKYEYALKSISRGAVQCLPRLFTTRLEKTALT